MKYILRCTVILLCLLSVACTFLQPLSAITVYEAKITAAVDGDTIKIQFTDAIPSGCSRVETVRLIGVNTPELFIQPPEYYAQEARDFVNRYWQQIVHIETDPDTAFRDKYGRLLVYVYIDYYTNNMILNKKLIEEGYGYYYGVFTFNNQYMYEFKAAEDTARENKKGLWK